MKDKIKQNFCTFLLVLEVHWFIKLFTKQLNHIRTRFASKLISRIISLHSYIYKAVHSKHNLKVFSAFVCGVYFYLCFYPSFL